ncbi:MAG: glycine zipper domain-containing protein [Magnetococcus sp. DMHC-8]
MKHGLIALAVVIGLLVAPVALRADAGGGATAGALSGALVGSLTGPAKHRAGNTLIGAVAGGLLGYAIGNEAEQQGRMVVHHSLETSPSYQTATWVNPETQVTYLVTPQPAREMQGRICRDVTIQATIEGRQENLAGLSCRDEYGQWRLMDRHAPVTTTPAQAVVVVPSPTQYVVTSPAPVYRPYPALSWYLYDGFGPHRHRRHHHHHHRGWGHHRY